MRRRRRLYNCSNDAGVGHVERTCPYEWLGLATRLFPRIKAVNVNLGGDSFDKSEAGRRHPNTFRPQQALRCKSKSRSIAQAKDEEQIATEQLHSMSLRQEKLVDGNDVELHDLGMLVGGKVCIMDKCVLTHRKQMQRRSASMLTVLSH